MLKRVVLIFKELIMKLATARLAQTLEKTKTRRGPVLKKEATIFFLSIRNKDFYENIGTQRIRELGILEMMKVTVNWSAKVGV
jgi:hypothetical protein